MPADQLVQVIGRLLLDGDGGIHVSVYCMRPINDNDLILHECLAKLAHETNVLKLKNKQAWQKFVRKCQSEEKKDAQKTVVQASVEISEGTVLSKEKQLNSQIMQLVETKPTLKNENGFTLSQLSEFLPQEQVGKVMTTLQNLVADSELYTTIDDFHYKSVHD